MRLIIFISIFVLPVNTCIVSESQVCSRAKNNEMSSSADRIHTTSKGNGKWSKRAGGGTFVVKDLSPYVHMPNLIINAIRSAGIPFIKKTSFTIARTRYQDIQVTLKTYIGTTGSVEIHDECHKWTIVGGLIPHPYIHNQRFYMLLYNFVPAMKTSILNTHIGKALSGQIRETENILVQNFVNYMLANPQELRWRRSESGFMIATPIYFATQTPIDMAISMATQPFAGQTSNAVFESKRPDFVISRTIYQNRQVTLKKYVGTTGLDVIDAECNEWRKIERLVGIGVGLVFNDASKQFYGVILGNFVPEMSQEVMHDAIKDAIHGRLNVIQVDLIQAYLIHSLANPQEFAWIDWQHNYWAIPIRFFTGDHIDSAISRATPFATSSGFFIARTWYVNRKVTLKTYTTINLEKIRADCDKWKNIGLLIDTAVDLAPDYTNNIKRFYMILGNPVPGMSAEDRHAAIAKAVGKDAKDHDDDDDDFANPQQYTWWGPFPTPPTWSAKPIHFPPMGAHPM